MTLALTTKVLLFCGGQSSRFWPVNAFMEKSMLPLKSGKPMVREIFDRLTNEDSPWGQQDVILLCHERHKAVLSHEFRETGVQIYATSDYLGTMGHFASAIIHNKADRYVVHYADMLCDVRYDRLETIHESGGRLGTIVTVKVRSPYSDAFIRGDAVTSFEEKPISSAPIWTGIGLFEHDVIGQFPVNAQANKNYLPDIGKDLLPVLASRQHLTAFQHNGNWTDLGNLQNYLKYIGA